MKRSGFTLVEIILSISLIGILFAVTAFILDRGIASFASITERGRTMQDVRMAMEQMVRELITVQAGPGGELTSFQSDRIQFVDSVGANAEFRLVGNTLNRGNNPLLNNVTALTFTGYRSDNQTTTAAPQVRRIRIQLTALPPGETAPIVWRTNVFLRTEMYENFQ